MARLVAVEPKKKKIRPLGMDGGASGLRTISMRLCPMTC